MRFELTVIRLSVAFVLAGCGDVDPAPAATPDPTPTPTEEAPEEPAPEPPTPAAAVPEETAAALEALGYLPTSPTDNPEERGVTVSSPRAQAGVNLYSTRDRASALLITNDGHVLHEWTMPAGEEHTEPWMHVEPLEGGDLLAMTKGRTITRHAWDSSIVWTASTPGHHDLVVAPDGRIFVLVRWADTLTFRDTELPILADGIVELSAEGIRGRRVELLPLVREEMPTTRLGRIRERVEAGNTAGLRRGGGLGDVLHTNSIEILHRAIPGVAPAGAFLLSFRNIDRVGILSPDLDELLWFWGRGELSGQHDATQLENGRVLIFDNGNRRRGSRAIEVDASTGEIAWSHTQDGLFSELRGGAQRLANGNTLITESDSGRALEVTAEGEVVWEFWNPDVRRSADGPVRGVIYRLNRFEQSTFPELARAVRPATAPTPAE